MDEKNETVIFRTEDGSEITFTVISETRLNGNNYILVTHFMHPQLKLCPFHQLAELPFFLRYMFGSTQRTSFSSFLPFQ